MGLNDIEAQRSRIKRLSVMQVVDQLRPNICSDGLVVVTLNDDPELDLTLPDVRRVFDYLAASGFVSVEQNKKSWTAKMLPKGVDFLEGHICAADYPGIAHPNDF